jgi:hypothetical protein
MIKLISSPKKAVLVLLPGLALMAAAVLCFQNCMQGFQPIGLAPATQLGSSTGPGPTPSAVAKLTQGEFIGLAGAQAVGAPVTFVKGRAQMIHTADARTLVSFYAWNLLPSTAYMAHVHAKTCAEGAGGHYQIDLASPSGAANEIWLNLTTSATGAGLAQTAALTSVRDDARSVVIHGPDGTKLGCADLTASDFGKIRGGLFSSLASGTALGLTVKGAAMLNARTSGYAEIRAAVSGLAPATAYMAHVHALPCEQGAGGHYQLDATKPTGQTNEIWLSFTTNAQGAALSLPSSTPFVVGDGAQSIVVHNPAEGTKIACANLNSGAGLIALDAGVTKSVYLHGFGTLARNLSQEQTIVTLHVEGLDPALTYMAHVHQMPCSAGAGGHSKKDPSVTVASEQNEYWMMLHANATGSVDLTQPFAGIAGPDAMSVVIHDPTDSTKLACLDLN